MEDITSHQSANSSHPNVRIAKKWEFKHGSKSTHYFEEESTTLPEAEKNTASYSLLFTMTRGNVITEDVLINAHPIKIGAALSIVSSETYHNIAQTNEIELLQEATVKLRTYMGERINIIFQCCMENLLRILLYT